MVSPYEVYFGKGGAAGKAVGIILYVWNWLPVRNGASIECSLVAIGSPTAVLGHEMEGRRPRYLGASGCSFPQRSMASNSALATAKQSGARRQAKGGPGVIGIWCVVL